MIKLFLMTVIFVFSSNIFAGKINTYEARIVNEGDGTESVIIKFGQHPSQLYAESKRVWAFSIFLKTIDVDTDPKTRLDVNFTNTKTGKEFRCNRVYDNARPTFKMIRNISAKTNLRIRHDCTWEVDEIDGRMTATRHYNRAQSFINYFQNGEFVIYNAQTRNNNQDYTRLFKLVNSLHVEEYQSEEAVTCFACNGSELTKLGEYVLDEVKDENGFARLSSIIIRKKSDEPCDFSVFISSALF